MQYMENDLLPYKGTPRCLRVICLQVKFVLGSDATRDTILKFEFTCIEGKYTFISMTESTESSVFISTVAVDWHDGMSNE
jgi:hypothetical protein